MNIGYLALAVLVSLYLNIPAFASVPSMEENEAQPNAEFINVCNQLFAGNGDVYDSSGIEITEIFVGKYYSFFQQADYAAILQVCFADGVSEIHAHEYSGQANSSRAVLHPTYEESVVHFVQQDGAPFDGKAWYLIVTATGTYTYQDSYGGYIVDFPVPTINISFSGLGVMFSGSVDSIRTTTPIINGKTASFSVTTVHTVGYTIEYLPGTLGPFTNISNFTIEGL